MRSGDCSIGLQRCVLVLWVVQCSSMMVGCLQALEQNKGLTGVWCIPVVVMFTHTNTTMP